MAEITNGKSGPARLAARVDIIEGIPPNTGPVAVGPVVVLNIDSSALSSAISALTAELAGDEAETTHAPNVKPGVVCARVSFWLGGRELCGHVLLQRSAARDWAFEIKALIEGKLERDVVYSAIESPELLMTAWRHDVEQDESLDAYYELLVVLDTGVFDPETGISGEGPGVFLSPEPEALLQFAEDLLAETENALR